MSILLVFSIIAILVINHTRNILNKNVKLQDDIKDMSEVLANPKVNTNKVVEAPKETEPKVEEALEDDDEHKVKEGSVNLKKVNKTLNYKQYSTKRYTDSEIRNIYLIHSLLNEAVMKNQNHILDELSKGIYDTYKISSSTYKSFINKLSKKDSGEYKKLIREYISKIEEEFEFEVLEHE